MIRKERLTDKRNQTRLFIVFLAIVAVLPYIHTLSAPFVFDDIPNILENPRIRMTRISISDIKRVTKSPHPFCSERIVSNLSFAVNYLLHRYDPVGYHFVNLLIHLVSVVLVFLIARQTMRLCRSDTLGIPFFSAALWAVSPIHVQSVTYIVQRMNSLATMFFLLTFLCYIAARNRQRQHLSKTASARLFWLLAVLFFVCAILSKQTSATLPFYLFLYEWFFFQNLDRKWLGRQTGKIALLLLVFGLTAFFFLGTSPLRAIQNSYADPLFSFSMPERLLTETRVVVYYISLLVFPHPARLNLDYDLDVSTSFLSPETTLAAFTALLALVIVSILSARKNRLAAFAIIWFLGNLVIESSVICLDLVMEHRVYLPSIFPCITFVWWLKKHLRPESAVVLLLLVGIGTSFSWTWQRNTDWRDPISLWTDTALKSPHKARPHTNLCRYLSSAGKTKEAIRHCRQSLRLSPDNIQAHNNLGSIYTARKQYDRAMDHYQQALAINPDCAFCYNLLGVLYAEQEKPENAIDAFQKAISLNPGLESPYTNLGRILIGLGRFHEAGGYLQQALILNPHSVAAGNNLGIVLFEIGRTEAALQLFKLCLRIDPDYRPAMDNILRIRGDAGPDPSPP